MFLDFHLLLMKPFLDGISFVNSHFLCFKGALVRKHHVGQYNSIYIIACTKLLDWGSFALRKYCFLEYTVDSILKMINSIVTTG